MLFQPVTGHEISTADLEAFSDFAQSVTGLDDVVRIRESGCRNCQAGQGQHGEPRGSQQSGRVHEDGSWRVSLERER